MIIYNASKFVEEITHPSPKTKYQFYYIRIDDNDDVSVLFAAMKEWDSAQSIILINDRSDQCTFDAELIVSILTATTSIYHFGLVPTEVCELGSLVHKLTEMLHNANDENEGENKSENKGENKGEKYSVWLTNGLISNSIWIESDIPESVESS